MLGRSFIFCALLLAAGQASALTIYKYVDQHGTVTYSDKAVPGAQVFVFRDRMVEKLDNLVKLETKKHDAGETLVLRNDLYAPVEVELRVERLVNVAGAPDEPKSISQVRTSAEVSSAITRQSRSIEGTSARSFA